MATCQMLSCRSWPGLAYPTVQDGLDNSTPLTAVFQSGQRGRGFMRLGRHGPDACFNARADGTALGVVLVGPEPLRRVLEADRSAEMPVRVRIGALRAEASWDGLKQ